MVGHQFLALAIGVRVPVSEYTSYEVIQLFNYLVIKYLGYNFLLPDEIVSRLIQKIINITMPDIFEVS